MQVCSLLGLSSLALKLLPCLCHFAIAAFLQFIGDTEGQAGGELFYVVP